MKKHENHEHLAHVDIEGIIVLNGGIKTDVVADKALSVTSAGAVVEGEELLDDIANYSTSDSVESREDLYINTVDHIARFKEIVTRHPVIARSTSDFRGVSIEIDGAGVVSPDLDTFEENGVETYPSSSVRPFGSASDANPLIYQFGKLDVVTHSTNVGKQVVRFPKPFPNEVLHISIQDVTRGGNAFLSRVNGTLPSNPDFDTLEASRVWFNPTKDGFSVSTQALLGSRATDETSYKTWMAVGR